MKGKYPTALIFLEVEPSEIDVNVHPSKKVVKFANQNAIFDLVKGEIENFFTDGIARSSRTNFSGLPGS